MDSWWKCTVRSTQFEWNQMETDIIGRIKKDGEERFTYVAVNADDLREMFIQYKKQTPLDTIKNLILAQGYNGLVFDKGQRPPDRVAFSYGTPRMTGTVMRDRRVLDSVQLQHWTHGELRREVNELHSSKRKIEQLEGEILQVKMTNIDLVKQMRSMEARLKEFEKAYPAPDNGKPYDKELMVLMQNMILDDIIFETVKEEHGKHAAIAMNERMKGRPEKRVF